MNKNLKYVLNLVLIWIFAALVCNSLKYQENEFSEQEILKYKEALSLCDENKYEEANRAVVMVCINTEHYAEAVALCTKILEKEPLNEDYLQFRSYCGLRCGEYEIAVADCTSLIEKNLIACYAVRGDAYLMLKKYREAIDDYSRTIQMCGDSTDLDVYTNRASAYMEIHEYEKALEDTCYIIERQPDNALNYVDRGLVYLAQYKHKQAIEDFNKALDIDENCAMAYIRRAQAYLGIKKYKKALKDCEKAFLIEPNNIICYKVRCLTYIFLKNKDAAEADLQYILQVDPYGSDVDKLKLDIKNM